MQATKTEDPLNYLAVGSLLLLHVLAVACIPYIYYYGVSVWEATLHIVFYFLGGFGITVLYHRAWAHGAVQLARPLEYFFAACATLVIQMPAKQWISSHIAHHKYTDHEDDPYNIQNGFWWAHCEWIFYMSEPQEKLPQRLVDNPVLDWQQKYYWPICFFMNIIVPVAVGIMVGAPWWGAVLLSALRVAIMGNVVYSVNSVCHYWGTQPFSKDVSARDVWWFPLALGEQYHNYHHAFPRDYRHGIRKLDFDPTKWLIDGFALVGLASNRVTMSEQRIASAREQARAEQSAQV